MVAVDITPKQDGGVLKEIIKEGTGDVTAFEDSVVTVHYTGYLLDGTKFDSSRDDDKPSTFKLQTAHLMEAWAITIPTMKKGEIAMITCAPKYAYGTGGFPPEIPPDTTVKYEIEMIDWEGLDLSPENDGSILKYQITQGKGYNEPRYLFLVNVHLVGSYNGRIFEDRDVQFLLGEGEEYGVVEGVEIALTSFKKKEKSRLRIEGKYAYGKEGKPEFNIPENATVEYVVKLKKFDTDSKLIGMCVAEKLELAKMYKEKGTEYFMGDKFKLAVTMYLKAHSFLLKCKDNDEIKEELEKMQLSLHLNLALCYLKTEQYAKAKSECDGALEFCPQNEKALFRRGQAYLGFGSPEFAIKDFQEVLRITPKNTAASKQIGICNSFIKKHLAKEKKLYANMFDRFAQEDKQKEEEKQKDQPDVMKGTLGEWGQEERPGGRNATAFEKENPNILMLNANGTGEFQNM